MSSSRLEGFCDVCTKVGDLSGKIITKVAKKVYENPSLVISVSIGIFTFFYGGGVTVTPSADPPGINIGTKF
jgi:hypothetical protein